MCFRIKDIMSIIAPKTNMSLIILKIKHGADQVIESYRRDKLLLFLVQKADKLNYKIKIDHRTKFSTQNRFNNIIYVNTDVHFRPECQKLFNFCKKVGYINIIKSNFIGSSKATERLAVLTNLGIIILNLSKYEFKDFIPLTFCKLAKHKSIRHSFLIVYDNGKVGGSLEFKSKADEREWTNSILRVMDGLKTNEKENEEKNNDKKK